MSGKTDGPPGNTGCCWHLLPFLSGSITVQYSVPHKAQLLLSFNLSGFSFLSDEWKHILDLGLDLVVIFWRFQLLLSAGAIFKICITRFS